MTQLTKHNTSQNNTETKQVNLIKIYHAYPHTCVRTFNGSPTVSPTTAAL